MDTKSDVKAVEEQLKTLRKRVENNEVAILQEQMEDMKKGQHQFFEKLETEKRGFKEKEREREEGIQKAKEELIHQNERFQQEIEEKNDLHQTEIIKLKSKLREKSKEEVVPA